MWSAVIADDEQVILNGLNKLLDWDKLGIQIVGNAHDGEALFKEISDKMPDIVISDIKMPKFSGMDVIKALSGRAGCPKFIFISGYEEFSYAKDAVKYGAVDYLLKPVGVAELEAAVRKAINQLEEHQTVSIFKQEKDELQQMFQKLNEGFEYAEETLYQRFEKENLDIESSFYVGICFSLIESEAIADTLTYEQTGLLRFGVYNQISEQFRKRRLGFLIKKEELFCDMMAVIPRDREDDFVQELLIPIKQEIEVKMSVRLCMGIGALAASIKQWKNSYKTSKFACELYYFEERDVIDFGQIHRSYAVSFEDFHQLLESAFQKIAAKDASALEIISKALAAIEDIHYGNRYAAVNRVLLFTGTLLEKLFVVDLINGDFTVMQNEVQEHIRYLSTYRQMNDWLIDYYDQLLKDIFSRTKHKTGAETMRVKAYIMENYNQDLSLKELADVACVSQTYFSSLFKKETGENYKSYVTKIRMEEAIRLTLKTDMKTYEIAEAVGYNNVRRFVDAFKVIYKMSPMDYRRIHG